MSTPEQRAARAAYMREWSRRNREKVQETGRRSRARNRDSLRERKREYYQRNRDEVLARTRAYQERHRDEILEKKRADYAQKRDSINAERRSRYAANREKMAAQRRAARQRNPERERELQRERYARDPEKRREWARAAFERDPEKRRAWAREDYRRNRDKRLAAHRAWRESNKPQVFATKLWRHHRMRPEDWATLWDAQQGRCYLCGEDMDAAGNIHVDHDHSCCPQARSCATCRRGLVHNNCNAAIGLAGDSPAMLRRMADALEAAQRVVAQRKAAAAVQDSLFPEPGEESA